MTYLTPCVDWATMSHQCHDSSKKAAYKHMSQYTKWTYNQAHILNETLANGLHSTPVINECSSSLIDNVWPREITKALHEQGLDDIIRTAYLFPYFKRIGSKRYSSFVKYHMLMVLITNDGSPFVVDHNSYRPDQIRSRLTEIHDRNSDWPSMPRRYTSLSTIGSEPKDIFSHGLDEKFDVIKYHFMDAANYTCIFIGNLLPTTEAVRDELFTLVKGQDTGPYEKKLHQSYYDAVDHIQEAILSQPDPNLAALSCPFQQTGFDFNVYNWLLGTPNRLAFAQNHQWAFGLLMYNFFYGEDRSLFKNNFSDIAEKEIDETGTMSDATFITLAGEIKTAEPALFSFYWRDIGDWTLYTRNRQQLAAFISGMRSHNSELYRKLQSMQQLSLTRMLRQPSYRRGIKI